jgi:hypothetical protein
VTTTNLFAQECPKSPTVQDQSSSEATQSSKNQKKYKIKPAKFYQERSLENLLPNLKIFGTEI